MKRGDRAPQRVLVVCCGNICRSPMGAALLRRLAGADVEIQSAGVCAVDGDLPTERAVSVMGELGFDISTHRSRNINNLDLSAFQLVVAMTESIAKELRQAGVDPARIVPLEVQDPMSSGIDVYRFTRDEIDRQLRCHVVAILAKPQKH